MPTTHKTVILAALALLGCGHAVLAEPAAAAYRLVRSTPLGEPNRWDYLAFDPASQRVFVAHGDRLTVVDAQTGAVVGQVGGMPGGTHGIVFSQATGQGFTDDGGAGQAVAFDLTTLKTGARIPAAADADAIAFDPVSSHVFVIDGDPGQITVIDPKTDEAIATVQGGGRLEFAVADGAGHVFVNGEEKREIVRIDTRRNVVDARYPIPDCESPHGLAIDPKSHRLFSSCVNSRLMVVNAESGAIIATLAIGRGSDAVQFDPIRHLIFSSDGSSGSIAVIKEETPDRFSALPEIATEISGRTMTLDPQTGRLFVAAAQTDPSPTAGGRPKPRPGSLRLLIYEPR
jgi:DNA-binding beta-propeller fold protein YncE